jgi:hypothetical protein
MISRGVPLTAGQAMGGLPRAFESTATALPFAGGLVEAAQKRATAEFSRTAVEDALKPLGLKLEKGVTGTTAVKAGIEEINKAYKKITPRLKIKDAESMRQSLKKSIDDSLEEIGLIDIDQEKSINKYLRDIIKILGGEEEDLTKAIAGRTFLQADQRLGKAAYEFSKPSARPQDKVVGEVLRNAQRALRDELEIQNSAARADLKKIHESYERLMPVQAAATRARAAREAGEFTPAELLSTAVSQRRRAGAVGEAPMQPEALRAQQILAQERSGIARPILETRPILGLLGGGALGATGAIAPAAAGLGLLAGAYSRAGVPITRELLRGTGEALRAPIPMTAGLLGAEFTE